MYIAVGVSQLEVQLLFLDRNSEFPIYEWSKAFCIQSPASMSQFNKSTKIIAPRFIYMKICAPDKLESALKLDCWKSASTGPHAHRNPSSRSYTVLTWISLCSIIYLWLMNQTSFWLRNSCRTKRIIWNARAYSVCGMIWRLFCLLFSLTCFFHDVHFYENNISWNSN